MRALALLRILTGPAVLLHLRPFIADAIDGRTYRDAFYEPYASWYPEPPRSLYVALLWVAGIAAVAMAVGLLTRIATAATFGIVTYNLFLSTTHFHNNRAYLVIVLAALTVAPCGRELAVDAWLRERRGLPPLNPYAPGWPLWLLRFEASAIYGASGLSKLLDPDWFGGTVTWLRVVRASDQLAASPLPAWAVTLASERSVHVYVAKAIVLTELFIAFGLWFRRTRYAAVWIAVCFHVAIEISAQVQVFSLLAIAALVIWAVPATRDRTLLLDANEPLHQRLASLTHSFDWLARFRLVDGPPGSPLQTIDRDGVVRNGGPAVAHVLSRLPVTAWFALPLNYCLRRQSRRRPEDPLPQSRQE